MWFLSLELASGTCVELNEWHLHPVCTVLNLVVLTTGASPGPCIANILMQSICQVFSLIEIIYCPVTSRGNGQSIVSDAIVCSCL